MSRTKREQSSANKRIAPPQIAIAQAWCRAPLIAPYRRERPPRHNPPLDLVRREITDPVVRGARHQFVQAIPDAHVAEISSIAKGISPSVAKRTVAMALDGALAIGRLLQPAR